MKKRTTINNRGRIAGNSRRRQLLKRVQHKVALRRHQFQTIESAELLYELY